MAPKKTTKASGGVEKRKAASKASGSSAAGSKAEKSASKAKKGALAVGDHLPDFSVETDASTDDNKVMQTSKDLTEQHGAVIFFYPKANTGGCTKQALGFNENWEKLEKAGYHVFGMSADKPKSQLNWKNKYGLKYTLLCDPSWQVLKSLGVTKGEKSIARSHIVVGKGGAIEDLQVGISPGDSVAKAVATILKSSGKPEPDANKEAEEIAEAAPGEDAKEPEGDEEKPKKKAKQAKGGKGAKKK